jgi:hypothetical protein
MEIDEASMNRLGAPGGEPAPAAAAPQIRLIEGRGFIRRGRTWVDAYMSHLPHLPRVRIKVDTRQYFDLVAQLPKELMEASKSSDVRFLFNNTVYEVHG